MAYHDENGKITIDEQAANKDVKRLQEAVQILSASRDAIRSLQRQAIDMKGETANAVLAKAQQMEKRLGDMIDKLESTVSYIKKVVRRYELLDEQIKQAIQSAANMASAVINASGISAQKIGGTQNNNPASSSNSGAGKPSSATSNSSSSKKKKGLESAFKEFGDAVDDFFDDLNIFGR